MMSKISNATTGSISMHDCSTVSGTEFIYMPAITTSTIYTNIKVKRVIYNDPATIVFFSDGTKVVVKRHENDVFDEQTGLLMCIAKKFLGKEELHRTLIKNVENYD